MKPIFYLNEYRTAAFYATYTRLLRWLHGFSPPLIYDSDTYTIPSRFSGINSLQQTFGSVSFTIVLSFFCVISSSVFSKCGHIYTTISTSVFCIFSYIKALLKEALCLTTSANEMIFKIQLLNHLKKIP